MFSMIRSITIGILTVALIGTGYWGYKEHQEKNAILIKSENTYQRAFHDLTYNIDLLHDEIGSTLAMNSRDRLSPSLAEVWRLTSEAQNDLGQLPLALMPFSKTEEYLYKIGDFSYRNAIRDLDNEPLTEAEYETLMQLYEQSGEIQDELRKVQSMIIQEDLRWMDVEMALASEDEPLDNAIIDGFKIVDEKVDGFAEVDFGPGAVGLSSSDEKLAESLEGKKNVTEQEAKELAKKFLNLKNMDGAEVTKTLDGLAYHAYNISIPDEKHGTNIIVEVTEKGGLITWMMNERNINEQSISLNEASENAKKFLSRNGFENIQLIDSKQYDNIGVFNFTKLEDNVRIYSQAAVVEVALDEGDIIGYEGFSYIENDGKERVDLIPSLSEEEARKFLNPNLQVMDHHVAVIKNQLEEEVLCHEFFGVINHDTYQIFINAENGREELVKKLANAEPIYRKQ